MHMTRNKAVIVLPVFNDGPSLAEVDDQLAAVLSDRLGDIALLIVDDGSIPTDRRELSHELLNGMFSGHILTLEAKCWTSAGHRHRYRLRG